MTTDSRIRGQTGVTQRRRSNEGKRRGRDRGDGVTPPTALNSQFPKSDDLIRAGDQLTDFHAHVLDQSCKNGRLRETWSWKEVGDEGREESGSE